MTEESENIPKNESKKRRYISADIKMKLKALDDLNKGISFSEIARKIGVEETTIRRWKKNEKELREWDDGVGNTTDNNKRKRLRKPVIGPVDDATWFWYQEQKESESEITSSLIKIQALHLWQLFHKNDKKNFNASDSWFSKWKDRRGIKLINSNDKTPETSYNNDFLRIIDGMNPEQIFSADEMNLYFRQLPKIAWNSTNNQQNSSAKLQRERLTVLACCNATGTFKLPLTIIGDSSLEKETSIDSSFLSTNTKIPGITKNLFDDWFYNQFVPKVKLFLITRNLPCRAILFVDNSLVHSKNLVDGEIRVELLPGHITSPFQPMVKGPLQSLKSIYRLSLMNLVCEKLRNGEIPIEILKKITIREVCFWLQTSWDCVNKSIIIESWRILWSEFVNSYTKTNSQNSEINEKNQINDFGANEQEKRAHEFCEFIKYHDGFITLHLNQVKSWLNPIKLWTEEECLNDEEIVELFKEDEDDEEDEENSVKISNNSNNPKPFLFIDIKSEKLVIKKPLIELTPKKKMKEAKSALESVDIVINYINGNPNFTAEHLTTLYSIREKILTDIEILKNTQNLT